MMMSADFAESLECHSAKINAETKLKLVLLAKREINWSVGNIEDVKQSEATIRQQKLIFSIEENAELPSLKLQICLVPNEDYYPNFRNNDFIDVQCYLLDGHESLSEGRIFYKIDLELLYDDGGKWAELSSDNEEREFSGIPDLWKNYNGDSHVFEYFNLWSFQGTHYGRDRLPWRKDGSLLFRLMFQFFTKRAETEFNQEINLEMEENWLGHFETRAKADKQG